MTFEVGRISAALTMDGVDQGIRQIRSVGDALDDAGKRGSSFGLAGEAAVRKVAGATTALTAAAGAYLAILIKQGVAYNSLQQNSRAALSVMLGGAEKANAQMSKLDDFARNSPFAKQVFIQAQQQLLGFGVEARKVIPYLDAIQQAVAATGGGNAEISGLVEIMAKIKSSAKITAEDLNMFGGRGVNAAKLIGDQMGKTANEIRTQISKGTLDAGQALDALAAGMQSTYGGATALVKQQWSGATDRIKGATRDLGAHLAEPFVSANGGGMAVTWANQVANVLRAIEKQAIPVMGILTQRGMPLFADLTHDLDLAQAAVQRWDPSSLEKTLDQLAAHAPAVAATAGALLAIGTQVGPLGAMMSALGLSANPVLAAFVGLAAASPELRDTLLELLSAGKPLLPVIGELATILSNSLNSALPLVSGGVEVLTAVLRPIVGLLQAIPAPVLLGATAFLAMHSATKVLGPGLQIASDALLRFGQQSQVQAALGNTTAGVGLLSTASIRARGAISAAGAALKSAFLSNPVGIALTAVSVLVGLWAIANANAQQKVEEHRQRVASLKDTLNQTTGALTDASRASIEANLAQNDAAESLKKLGYSTTEATDAVISGGSAYADLKRKIEDNISVAEADADAINAGTDARKLSNEAGNSLLEMIVSESAAIRESQEATRQKIQIDREEAAALGEAGRSNRRFNEALQVARDITQDAETRVRGLIQALDELKGGTISAEEAQIRLTRTAATLKDGLSRTSESGKELWKSTLSGKGAIDVTKSAGADFAETMQRARKELGQAAISASDVALANGDVAGAVEAARSAGDDYIRTLRKQMRDAGLTKEQIHGLTSEYLDVPSVVATLLTDNGTISEIDQQALALANQLNGLPKGASIKVDNPGGPELIAYLEDLGFKVKTLPKGRIQVTQTGAEAVENLLTEIVTKKRVAQVFIDSIYRTPAPAGPVKISANGNLFDQGRMQAFANGGFPTGIFPGGRPILKFAEPETGWEAFISGRKGQEARNAKIAMESLRRLGFPVIPVSALRGIPAFANGGFAGASSPPSIAPASVRVDRRRRGNGPLVGNVFIGQNTSRNDLRELEETLDRIKREG